MSETIRLMVDIEKKELLRVSQMLAQLARGLNGVEPLDPSQYPETAKLVKESEDTVAHVTTHSERGGPTAYATASEDLVTTETEDTTAHVTGGEEAAPPPPATDSPTLNDEEIKEIAASVPPPNVDTAPDSTGVQVPWDVRIHSGAKTQYAPPRTGWKLKRGVSGALLETVEAELRAVMAASPANPVTATTDAAAAFGAATTEEAAPPPPATDAETEAPAITNFAELNVAITEAAIDPVTVMAAVNKVGLAVYPLLGAREDLVPLVVAELFPSKEG